MQLERERAGERKKEGKKEKASPTDLQLLENGRVHGGLGDHGSLSDSSTGGAVDDVVADLVWKEQTSRNLARARTRGSNENTTIVHHCMDKLKNTSTHPASRTAADP